MLNFIWSKEVWQDKILLYEEWISFYSKNMGIDIVFDDHLPAPAAVPDKNWDISEPKIIINPNICMEKFNFTSEEFFFVIFHEIEHIIEEANVKKNKNDLDIFEQRKERFLRQEKLCKWREKAYHDLENSLRDVFVNKQIISPKKVPALLSVVRPLYNKLFPSINYLESVDKNWKLIPKHIQFVNALLREWMLPDEPIILDSDVRKVVTRLQRNSSFKEVTTWWLKKRLQNIWKLIEPSFTKFLNEDIKNRNLEENDESNENGLWNTPKEEKNNQNPFDVWYKSDSNQPHILEWNIDPEKIKKIKEIIKENVKNQSNKKSLSKEEKDINNRVSLAWWLKNWTKEFDEKKKELSEYLSYLKSLYKIKNKKTNQPIVSEIADTFESIKSRRLKPYYSSKWPVDSEHGVRLHWPSIADGIGSIYSGEDDPYMWEKDVVIKKLWDFVSNFELTLITDWSWSMAWIKNQEQKKACLSIFEGLKLLHDKLQQESDEIFSDLSFTTEWLMFDWRNVNIIKNKSTEFNDKQRVLAYRKLDRCNWWNNETDALDFVSDSISFWSRDYKDKIISWETKKIVIMISDGLWDIEEIKKSISKLRSLWTIVYWIMIDTEKLNNNDKRDILSTYQDKSWWNNAFFCSKPEDLSIIINNLLRKYLLTI